MGQLPAALLREDRCDCPFGWVTSTPKESLPRPQEAFFWERSAEAAGRTVGRRAIRTVVTKAYPLSQAPDAWRYQMSGHTRGKVVLEVSA
jgi:NADPH:quinone reductase-like Zn-dependent oxidoreductase